MLENIFSNKRARAWGNLYVGISSIETNQYATESDILPTEKKRIQIFSVCRVVLRHLDVVMCGKQKS